MSALYGSNCTPILYALYNQIFMTLENTERCLKLAMESANCNTSSNCVELKTFIFLSLLDLTLQRMQRIEGGQEIAIQIGCVMAALSTLALAGYLYFRYKRSRRYDIVV